MEIVLPHWAERATISIDHARVRTVKLAAATHRGQGKYDDVTDRIVPSGNFHLLTGDDGFYK